ncbi:sensor histidine kinase [Actinocorallia populi]|uniref:sensor histidine kinase n=1 Tax=Actinocorallia populi TaxID=2079200 RepID=UPI000D094F53|nr:HAMP domain-containing sensor histidine kinase [Actinocorallia populi]
MANVQTAPLVFGLSSSQDVFTLRRSAKRGAEALGMEQQDQVRLATALSELGRELLGAADLSVTFGLEDLPSPAVVVVLAWRAGPPPVAESLELSSRLVQEVRYEPGDERDRIFVRQPLPRIGASLAEENDRFTRVLRENISSSELDDLRAQTRDLAAALEETRAQREELLRLNEELEETNKGVMALYSELTQELETTNSGVLALHTELEDKSRQLRDVSEAKTRFWVNISHELRTPVNAVVALSRLLLASDSGRLSEEQKQQVELIANSGHTMLALVSDLLDVAKAESGQLDIHLGPTDLRLLVGQLSGVLRGAYPRDAVTLVTPEAASLPVITTDETLLTRILRNLLSNALKFTTEGEVRLSVDADRTGPEPVVLFTITDTGVGIPEEDVGRVFEEFYQVRGEHQSGRKGTGLGLPYARKLAELLGGALTLTSTLGVGTRVEVRVPDRTGARRALALERA